MVCSRDFQGVDCIDGDPGGVADGLWEGVDRPALGNLGLDRGEELGLPLRLAFLLTRKERTS